jgi:hypothetical protein
MSVDEKGTDMSQKQQTTAGIIGLVLIASYSWIMTTTDGTASSWAWIMLAAAIVLLASTARSVAIARAEQRGD